MPLSRFLLKNLSESISKIKLIRPRQKNLPEKKKGETKMPNSSEIEPALSCYFESSTEHVEKSWGI